MTTKLLLFSIVGFVCVSCAGIKTRDQLRMEGIKVERANANVSTEEKITPKVQTQTIVKEVVVEKAQLNSAGEAAVVETVVKADPVSQKLEMAAELRRISGELQDIKDQKELETKKNEEFRQSQEMKLQLMQNKLVVYEQSIAALEEEIIHLKSLKAKPKAKKKGIFETAEDHMKNKDWKKAILEFENYRKKYPRGRRISLATYYIGVSFQELGLKEEAKAFFQETIDKYPKTSAYNKASYRLKQLK